MRIQAHPRPDGRAPRGDARHGRRDRAGGRPAAPGHDAGSRHDADDGHDARDEPDDGGLQRDDAGEPPGPGRAAGAAAAPTLGTSGAWRTIGRAPSRSTRTATDENPQPAPRGDRGPRPRRRRGRRCRAVVGGRGRAALGAPARDAYPWPRGRSAGPLAPARRDPPRPLPHPAGRHGRAGLGRSGFHGLHPASRRPRGALRERSPRQRRQPRLHRLDRPGTDLGAESRRA